MKEAYFWDAFNDYMEATYFPDAVDELPPELVQFEFDRYSDAMAY